MTTTYAWNPALHPRTPRGGEHGGEFLSKLKPGLGAVALSVVRPEIIAHTEELRRQPGQGTRYTRTTTPVEGKPGARDAILIQAEEFFASLPPNMQESVKSFAKFDDERIRLYNTMTQKRLGELTSRESGARVAVRVPNENVEAVLRSGHILSAHDPEHQSNDRSSSERYMTGRSAAEKKVWSIDSDDPNDRPVYGYVATDNENLDSIARAFGDVKFTLRDDVRPHTTITYSDSLFINVDDGDAVPSPIDDPSYLSVAHWMNLAGVEVPVAYKGEEARPEPPLPPDVHPELRWDALEKLGYLPWRHGDFIEAQIHGGAIDLSQVERIDFPEGMEIAPSLRTLLDSSGIPWTIGGPA